MKFFYGQDHPLLQKVGGADYRRYRREFKVKDDVSGVGERLREHIKTLDIPANMKLVVTTINNISNPDHCLLIVSGMIYQRSLPNKQINDKIEQIDASITKFMDIYSKRRP